MAAMALNRRLLSCLMFICSIEWINVFEELIFLGRHGRRREISEAGVESRNLVLAI